jgi:hypothetical protein
LVGAEPKRGAGRIEGVGGALRQAPRRRDGGLGGRSEEPEAAAQFTGEGFVDAGRGEVDPASEARGPSRDRARAGRGEDSEAVALGDAHAACPPAQG